ncbi:MAG TPA: glycosyltransferase, partial [Candidatus Angelobacter sp.]|nr:glycosyltransferase [Candidatus Angelobacter sp.]
MIDYSVVTATYNEAQNILSLLSAIQAALNSTKRTHEILVVDDDSPDGTGALVQNAIERNPDIRLLRRVGERGIGS